MNLLVTGGYGFIGSHFVEQQVIAGNKVFVWDLMTYAASFKNIPSEIASEIYFTKVDISDSNQVRSAANQLDSIDWIVNFAAESHVDQSIRNPLKFISSNVLGTVNLLELNRTGIASKFFQVSTDEVYGSSEDGSWTEESILNPRSPYSASKAAAEHFVNSYRETYSVPCIVSRCANNYGPRQSLDKLIPKIIWKLKNLESIPIYGDGLNSREWIDVKHHVNSISELISASKNNGVYGVYNIAGIERNNLQIVNEIAEIMGIDIPRIEFVADRLGHDRRYAMNDDKIKLLLNTTQQNNTSLVLAQTVEWYLQNPEWVQESLSKIEP